MPQTDGSASASIAVSPEAGECGRDGTHLPPSTPLQDDLLKDEVLRKIGRNLALFQQLERALKFLVANGAIDGYASELQKLQEEKDAAVSKKTMGQLVGDFIKGHVGAEDSGRKAPEQLREAWFSFHFSVEADEAFHEQRKAAFDDMLAERNELAHHLLARWDVSSADSTRELGEYLDRQREKALTEFEVLRGMVKSFEEGRRAQAEFLASEEGLKELKLVLLRSSRLVIFLVDIAHRLAREDGCVLLNTASDLLRQHAPDEYATMRKRHGYKCLKALILATELFDVIEEPTKKGGRRIYYRLKGFECENRSQPSIDHGAAGSEDCIA